MAITPVSPTISVPIVSEAVNIDIAPTSQFGQAYDVARITTIIRLKNPLESSRKFLLPKSDELWSPKMTTENGAELQYTLDGIDSGALEKLKQQYKAASDQYLQNPAIDNRSILQELVNKIYELSQYTTSQDIPAGTKLIKFSFTKPINKDNTGLFVLENLVPMASFSMQNGSKIHAIIAMPFDPPVAPSNVTGTWSQNAPNSASQAIKQDNIENRTFLHAFWQQDPLLTIKYHY
ncbi:hypothetical protein [Clostridium sp. BJN0013]|uniref:hypothetical protein n=1 Tax=Clostridium sp. BJN0013 TaxID=3236840 RepID=UPI0034C6B369